MTARANYTKGLRCFDGITGKPITKARYIRKMKKLKGVKDGGRIWFGGFPIYIVDGSRYPVDY